MTDAYEIIEWRGKLFDRMTVQAIEAAEKVAGQTFTIYQGSYNGGGVSASAGTHDGGGAVDIKTGVTPDRLVRALRTVGFAAWHRLPSEGPWGEHIHAVLNGNAKLSPSAERQVIAYKAGANGLASNLRDATWRPTPIRPYVYKEPVVSPGQQFKNSVLAACRTALIAIPERRRYQRGLVVSIRTIARKFPTP